MKQPRSRREDGGDEEGGNTERRGRRTGGNTGERIRGDEERGNTEELPALRNRCGPVLSGPKAQSKDAAPPRFNNKQSDKLNIGGQSV